MTRALIAGGSEEDRRILTALVRDAGCSDVSSALDARAALDLCRSQNYDLLLLDLMQPRSAVTELFALLRARPEPNATAILVTIPPEEVARGVQCIKWGAADYLTAPYNPTVVKARVSAIIERKTLSDEIVRMRKIAAEALDVEVVRKYSAASTRFVPREFLENLQRKSLLDVKLGDHVLRDMTVFFSDIRNFTTLSEAMTPQQNFNFLNSYFQHVNPIIRTNNGFIDKYIGDAIMALFPNHSRDALTAAVQLQRQVARYNEGRRKAGYAPISIGIGMHRGDLILGTIGEDDRMQTTVISDAVNTASRMEGMTKIFNVSLLVSDSVVSGLGENTFALRHLGAVKAKGKTSRVDIHECYENDPMDLAEHKTATANLFATALAEFGRGTFLTAGRLFQRVAAAHPGDGPAAYYRDRCSMIVLRGTGPGPWDGADLMEAK
ncbi:MAG: hypothetical protein NVSMB64_18690 [Candidatus Velthaea sp.]